MTPESSFTGAVALVFGIFSWAQFPALCGFMFSSTRVGADNFRYSLYLGGMLAIIGLFSGMRALLRGPRGGLLVAGTVLNVAFLVAAVVATDRFDVACHALYIDVTEE